MKHVQESLYEFEDSQFFGSLNEEKEKETLSPADKKKMKEELQKKGMAVVQKCVKNFDNFKKFAGDIWQEYRDFWASQKDANESVDQKGMFYNLWKSDYIVGVVKEPTGNAALKVFNTSAEDQDEYVAFETKNPDVVNAFKDFLEGVVKYKMKDVIEKQKASMEAKKKADEQRSKEEAKATKQAKLDAFLSESNRPTSKKKLNEARNFSAKYRASDILQYANKHYSFPDDIEYVLDGGYGEEMEESLLQVKNPDEFWSWIDTNFQ